ncbi:MAG: hypothetical protein KDA71_14860 [Planctomycetales bacterium]|nr:hypothetical protein [Planctomycetales bacterium]
METSGVTAAASQSDFLTLLTTQMRYQDPLEPTKQEDFTQQLAQFATLENMEQLNANFSGLAEALATQQSTQLETLDSIGQLSNSFGGMLALQQLTQGASIAGRVVEYNDQGVTRSGVVDRVVFTEDQMLLEVDGESISLGQVKSIAAES